ncbi:YL1 nuclear [Penicillium capsulatum]|uniref:YL1 nuclear n=1 Tax=Penicillium capsulatum TaxID=69766 RepID=A0A9W9ILC5_9EURO|nr:YL1 nuclear [Penicillium capsulatum]KAJ6122307.1 YL1 nuclear [Penicillium capsulatum]
MADIEEDPSSGLQSSDEDEEVTQEQVESLVQGRAKRSTAGQHMSALIDAAADDDLTLLFEEVEDDNEFADADAGDEEDMGLDSSDDDDDDQGPNAQNDYEGEQELQKEERKKRRAQNDLRFQTLRKRVKIDPTAVSAVPPSRPKKKSERISWLPTVEDGPTRSSSRRQTMHNKEMTHARLKDSQEKRVRIIATMKEAEKRKAHLKPKEMTQEDHLAEAARMERLNSKSLNRWEQTEKRKADERRAKIEALQNRRLEGPVISYWSGLATWTNGRLTRVGRADIKVKPEKTESKKSKKDEKPAAEPQPAQSATPAPVLAHPVSNPINGETPQPTAPAAPAAPVEAALPSDANTTQDTPASESIPVPPAANPVEREEVPEKPEEPSEKPVGTKEKPPNEKPVSQISVDTEKKIDGAETKTPPKPMPANSISLDSEGNPIPVVETPAPRRESLETSKPPPNVPAESLDPMEVDKEPSKEAPKTTEAANPPATESTNPSTALTAETPAVSEQTPQSSDVPTTAGLSSPPVTLPTGAPAAVSLGTQASSTDAMPMQAMPPDVPAAPGPSSGPVSSAPTDPADGAHGATSTPSAPPPPPVIEHTGRNLTILEDFDYSTAHSKKYSMYFNARKPPRLAKISSSLCVITSLPSRFRDPQTSLPYANSYAYGQIRRMMSQGYIWSSMLGCFVGPPDTAARGVPDRFLGKPTVKAEAAPAESTTDKGTEKSVPSGTTSAEPMEIDS